MADSDKPDPQALILKQLKSIKITLWAVVVLIVLFTGGGVVGGGVIAGIKAFYFSGGDESTADGGTAHIEWGPEEAAENTFWFRSSADTSCAATPTLPAETLVAGMWKVNQKRPG